MPGLKKLKENIGRRWSLCSQNATQINFPRALLDTCPFCIESFYIEKKNVYLLSSLIQNLFWVHLNKKYFALKDKYNLCRIMFNGCTHFFSIQTIYAYIQKGQKWKGYKEWKKAVDVYVCPPLWIFLIIMQPYWNVSILISHYWSFPQPSYGGDV